MKEPKKPLARLWGLLKNYNKEVTQIYFYAILNGIVNLSLPLGIQAIVNLIQVQEVTTSWIILVLVVLVGIAITGVFQVLQLRIVENIQQDIFARSAFEFAWRIPKIRLKELDSIHAPELVNRFFDTLTIQKGIPKILIDFSLAAFQIVFGLLLLAFYSPYFIILGIGLIAILYIIFKITGPKGLRTSIAESSQKYRMAHWLEEVARTNKSFKIYSQHELHLTKSDSIGSQYIKNRESHFQVLLSQFRYFIGFKVLVAAGLLLLGGYLVFEGRMNLGQFVASEIIIILIINSVEKLIRIIDTIYDVLTSLEKIGYFTDLDIEVQDHLPVPLTDEGIKLSISNIRFKYENQFNYLIDGLNCDIPSSSKFIITGNSGAGKSTLLKLITGMWKVESGDIRINDISINHIDLEDYYNHVGVYFPTNQLFEGTIGENITMGRPIAEQRVYAIIKQLKLEEFLSHQIKGLDTEIDAEGKTLPRSVIQKLLLARCLVHQPKLLLLEEPLSSIPETEKETIARFIMDPEHKWTVLVVADYAGWHDLTPDILQL